MELRPGWAGSFLSLASSAITLSAPQGGVRIRNYRVGLFCSVLLIALSACGGSSGDTPGDDGDTPTATTEEGAVTTAAAGERAFLTLDPTTSALVMVDPDGGEMTDIADFDTPPNVTTLAIGGGSVWIGRDNGSILRVSAASGEIEAEIATGSTDPIIGLSFSDDAVWALQGIPGIATTVSITDPATNSVVQLVTAPEGASFMDIAAGEGSGWVIGANTERVTILFEIDPASGDITERDTSVSGNDVTAGGGVVWIAGTGFSIEGEALEGVGRFVPSSGETTFFQAGLGAENVAFDNGAIWLSDPLGDGGAFVHRLNPDDGAVLASIQVGNAYAGTLPIYVGAGFVWAQTTGSDGEITVIDPSNNEVAGIGDSPGPYPMLFP